MSDPLKVVRSRTAYDSLVKPFDVDLDWMAKYKNVQKAAFWSADSDEGKTRRLL